MIRIISEILQVDNSKSKQILDGMRIEGYIEKISIGERDPLYTSTLSTLKLWIKPL